MLGTCWVLDACACLSPGDTYDSLTTDHAEAWGSCLVLLSNGAPVSAADVSISFGKALKAVSHAMLSKLSCNQSFLMLSCQEHCTASVRTASDT